MDSILSLFENEARSRAIQRPRAVWAMRIIQGSPQPARRDSLLAGLQSLALHSDNFYVRLSATNYFGEAGSRPQHVSIVEGLQRIFHGRNARRLQSTVLNKLPYQVERPAAVAFLRSVAALPDVDGPHPVHGHFTAGDPRTLALQRLSEMGEEGLAALRSMHRSGEAGARRRGSSWTAWLKKGFLSVICAAKERRNASGWREAYTREALGWREPCVGS